MIPRDDVLRMAREAGFEVHPRKQQVRVGVDALLGIDSTEKLERFAYLVEARAAAAEREACAKVCLKKGYGYDGGGNRYLVFKNYSPEKCAEAIRARGAA